MEQEDALGLAMDLDPVFAQRPPVTAVYAALRLVMLTLFFLSSASTSFRSWDQDPLTLTAAFHSLWMRRSTSDDRFCRLAFSPWLTTDG